MAVCWQESVEFVSQGGKNWSSLMPTKHYSRNRVHLCEKCAKLGCIRQMCTSLFVWHNECMPNATRKRMHVIILDKKRGSRQVSLAALASRPDKTEHVLADTERVRSQPNSRFWCSGLYQTEHTLTVYQRPSEVSNVIFSYISCNHVTLSCHSVLCCTVLCRNTSDISTC